MMRGFGCAAALRGTALLQPVSASLKITDMSKEKIKIELYEWMYECGDGCCISYGTTTKVNGVEMELQNQDAATIVEQILQHLGYDVEIIETYNGV
jgi:predicted metal-binding protein